MWMSAAMISMFINKEERLQLKITPNNSEIEFVNSLLKTNQSEATVECWIRSVRDIYKLTTTHNCHLFWLACQYSISWLANNMKPKHIPAAISNKPIHTTRFNT